MMEKDVKQILNEMLKILTSNPDKARTLSKISALTGSAVIATSVLTGSLMLCSVGMITYGVASFLLGMIDPA